jgi:hypothetical protein
MDDGHERFEGLAVGHVLGGLDPVDAAEFRTHLVNCRACRMRVAELRDIASELAAAEREERAAARVATETVRRAEDEDAPVPGWHPGRRAVALTAVVVTLVLVAVLFWNFHLRGNNAALVAVSTTREAILAALADGEPLTPRFAEGVTGIVTRDGDRVALSIGGVPSLAQDEVVVTWLLNADGVATSRFAPVSAVSVEDGLLALYGEHRGAHQMAITIEERQLLAGLDGPTGRVLVEADLRPAR